MKHAFSRQVFESSSNIKFRQNPSSDSRVVPSGRTDGRQKDMMKLTVAFRNFANAPKKIRSRLLSFSIWLNNLHSDGRRISFFI
jgi:hypothetical protein